MENIAVRPSFLCVSHFCGRALDSISLRNNICLGFYERRTKEESEDERKKSCVVSLIIAVYIY